MESAISNVHLNRFAKVCDVNEHGENQKALNESVVLQWVEFGIECRGKVQEDPDQNNQEKHKRNPFKIFAHSIRPKQSKE